MYRFCDSRLISASLLGGAVGDALGAEIEFWTLNEILERFPNGVNELLPHQGIKGAITDDTQMTLFTAEALSRAGRDAQPTTIGVQFHKAYLRWLKTQGYQSNLDIDLEGSIALDSRLQKQRAPGNTCLESLMSATKHGEFARNNSKGCGTIMRIAPIAFGPLDTISSRARMNSALTHGHETAHDSANAWAMLLAHLWRGGNLESYAHQIADCFEAETKDAIELALSIPRDGNADRVDQMNGGGWTAEDALAIALYASLSAQSFEHGLQIAVMHSGDSDSTGAIAGNMLGLLFPEEVFAHRWSAQIECVDLIEKASEQLLKLRE